MITASGAPSRAQGIVYASSAASPECPAVERLARCATSSSFASMSRNALAGGVAEYSPYACFVQYHPSALASPTASGSSRSRATSVAIACME